MNKKVNGHKSADDILLERMRRIYEQLNIDSDPNEMKMLVKFLSPASGSMLILYLDSFASTFKNIPKQEISMMASALKHAIDVFSRIWATDEDDLEKVLESANDGENHS